MGGFNLFGSSDKKSSTTNDFSEGKFDNNQGDVAYGNQKNTTISTDHGAVTGALANNLASTQAALATVAQASNNQTQSINAALAANGALAADAFNFGAQSLDLGGYAIQQNSTLADAALSTVAAQTNSIAEKFADLTTKVLVNGEQATSGALSFAKHASNSEQANIGDLLIKGTVVLGAVVVLGLMFGGKK